MSVLAAALFLVLRIACGGGGGGDGGGTTTPPPAQPDFSIAVSPSSTTIRPGQSGDLSINATRSGGHSSAIALTLVSPPSGITGSANIPSGSNTATLTLSVDVSVPLNTYALNIQSSDGTRTHTTPFSLTVGATTPCTWRFDTSASPSWFAVQDGTGAWTPISGSAGTFTFNLTQTKGAVAYVLTDGTGSSDVCLSYGSDTELANKDFRTIAGDNLTVSGTYANLGSAESADFNLGLEGYAYASGVDGAAGAWAMDFVDKGLHDLLAVRFNLSLVPNRMVIHRSIDVQSAGGLGAPGAVNFDSDGTTPTAHTLTISGLSLISGEILRA
jgi:hypothetical protein